MTSSSESFYLIEPCATSNGYEIKLKDKNQKIDIKKAEFLLSKLGTVVGSTPVVVVGGINNYSLNIYASGRIMVKSQKRISVIVVRKFAELLMSEFKKNQVLR